MLTINSKENDLAEPRANTIACLTCVMTFMWWINCSNKHRTIARDDKSGTWLQSHVITWLFTWKRNTCHCSDVKVLLLHHMIFTITMPYSLVNRYKCFSGKELFQFPWYCFILRLKATDSSKNSDTCILQIIHTYSWHTCCHYNDWHFLIILFLRCVAKIRIKCFENLTHILPTTLLQRVNNGCYYNSTYGICHFNLNI